MEPLQWPPPSFEHGRLTHSMLHLQLLQNPLKYNVSCFNLIFPLIITLNDGLRLESVVGINLLRDKCTSPVFIIGSSSHKCKVGKLWCNYMQARSCQSYADGVGQVDRKTDGWRKKTEGGEEKAGHQLLCLLFRYVQQKEAQCEGLKWGKRPCCDAITCWWKMTAGWDLLIPLIQAGDHSEYNYQTAQTLTYWLR